MVNDNFAMLFFPTIIISQALAKGGFYRYNTAWQRRK